MGLFDSWKTFFSSTPSDEPNGGAGEPSHISAHHAVTESEGSAAVKPSTEDTVTASQAAGGPDVEAADAHEAGASDSGATGTPAPGASADAAPKADDAAGDATAQAAVQRLGAGSEVAAASSARTVKARPAELDDLLAGAVDVARGALLEVVDPAHVGQHSGAVAEGQRLVTHSFECLDPAYRGWHWVAVLARAPRSKKVTVCETALLPGPDSLVSPEWLPWAQRVRPGDLGPRDVLPKLDADPNLEPGYQQVETREDDNVDQIANFEFGLGRERVLSPEGIANAATRWSESESGPRGEFAAQATQSCGSCGYLLPIAGSVRTQFGVCANEWSPFDGRIVSLDAGCGAHSETEQRDNPMPVAQTVLDETEEDFDMLASSETAEA